MRGMARSLASGFADVDIEKIRGDLELVFRQRGGEGLPFERRVEGLPVGGIAGLDRHGEAGFVGAPFVEHRVCGLRRTVARAAGWRCAEGTG